MKRAFIVHGWGGYPDEGWFPWLKESLEKRGFRVEIVKMPHSENPTISDWVKTLSIAVGKPDENTFFIGHSIGCQTILRYLEQLNVAEKTVGLNNEEVQKKKVGGAVFVAGWFNLENIDDEEDIKIAQPWLTTPIDFNRVRASLRKSTLIISDNDPFGAFEENRVKFRELGSKIVVLEGAGHINGESRHYQLPEALAEFEEL